MENLQEQTYMMNFYNNEHNKKGINIEEKNVDNEENKYGSEDDESITSSSFEDSNNSKGSSSSSLDLLDDASSSTNSSPTGPLYGLSEIMDQLPIKRGLSKYYQGKSQSFTSLARVTSLEDLAKKETPYQRRLKASTSYGGGLNHFRSRTISKKGSNNNKGSLSNLSSLNRKNSFVFTLPPLHHVQTTS